MQIILFNFFWFYRLNTEVEVLSSLLWHPLGPDSAHPLIFSTSTGHLGSLSKSSVYPSEGDACRPSVITDTSSAMATDNDPLVDDSLLMEVDTCIHTCTCMYVQNTLLIYY